MSREVDARGLSCPEPVILVRQAIQADDIPFDVLVDSVTSLENVRRLATRAGLRVQVEGAGDEYRLTIMK